MRLTALARLASFAVAATLIGSMTAAGAVIIVPSNFQSIPDGYSEPLDVPVEPGDSPQLIQAIRNCSMPTGGLVCVPVGGSAKLHLSLTCKLGAKEISCGHVTWSTNIKYAQLRGSFKPNPAPPWNGKSTETIDASNTATPGNYGQELHWACTGYAGCKGNAYLPITILKAT